MHRSRKEGDTPEQNLVTCLLTPALSKLLWLLTSINDVCCRWHMILKFNDFVLFCIVAPNKIAILAQTTVYIFGETKLVGLPRDILELRMLLQPLTHMQSTRGILRL